MSNDEIPPLPIGTETKWGTVVAVGNGGNLGERYYWMSQTTASNSSLSMIPACEVEHHPPQTPVG